MNTAPDTGRLGAGRYLAAGSRPESTAHLGARADHRGRGDRARRAGHRARRHHRGQPHAPAPGPDPPSADPAAAAGRGGGVDPELPLGRQRPHPRPRAGDPGRRGRPGVPPRTRLRLDRHPRALRRRAAVRVLPRASRAGTLRAHRDYSRRPPGQAGRRRAAAGRRRDLPGPAPRAGPAAARLHRPLGGGRAGPDVGRAGTGPVQPGQRVRRAARELGLQRGIPGPLPGRAARPRRPHRRRRPGAPGPRRRKHAPPSAPAATRSTAAGRWPPGSSPSSAPTPTRAPSTCPWIPANGRTDRCSASAPT